MKPILVLTVALILTGCAYAPNYAKPGTTAQDQRQQEAACRMEARRMGTQDNPFLQAAGQMRQYDDCMVAAGYVAR